MFKKINSILSKQHKRSLVGIFFLMLVSALLDLVGVSMILPIISILSEGDAALTNNAVLHIISNLLNTTDLDLVFVISLLLLVLMVLIKCIYGVVYNYIVNRFSLEYSRKLTHKLMNTYLSMPYEFHLENNSSTLMRKSIYDVECFIDTIRKFLDLAVTGITILLIVGYLMFISYSITLIVGGLLLICSLIIIFLLRPKTRKLSKSIQQLNSNNYKHLAQAFNGIKESKISHTEKTFSDIYDENRMHIGNAALKRSMINAIPRQLIEFIGILGICLSLALIKITDNNATHIIEMFTVFVYAIIKLLPLVISSTSIINSFSFYKASIDTIYDDLNAIKEVDIENYEDYEVKPLEFSKVEVNNVKFAYRTMSEKTVLDDVSLSFDKNTSIAISGASGCGKTTLVDIILGLLKPQEGNILVDGKNINENMIAWRKNISYIPQHIFIGDDTIRNNVAFGIKPECIKEEDVINALKKAELYDFVMSLPEGLNTVVGERGVRLSGGQRQRIGIARAFYRNTNIIVFDEATNALDYEIEQSILDQAFKYSNDHTLIIISHRMNTIEQCEHIYEIKEHKIEKVK